jgi:hypothetical protein
MQHDKYAVEKRVTIRDIPLEVEFLKTAPNLIQRIQEIIKDVVNEPFAVLIGALQQVTLISFPQSDYPTGVGSPFMNCPS